MQSLLVFILLSILSSSAFSLERKVFCIWDPVGRNGPVMAFYSDVIPKAQAWGLSIRFVAYTDERVAANDFKAGRCEAVLLTSILARQFVKFGGTMDAIGAINSQKGLELALATLARPRAGKLMTEGNYEVIATFPVGSMFAFVNDRSINTIDAFAGKKISILNGDPQMQKFADLAGASKVNVSLATFAGRFNSGEVDIVVMPALAYNTFELYHGLKDKGGIIDYRLYYGMLQAIAKRDQFPEGFGHTMRRYILTRMKAMKKMVKDAEQEIPKKYWIKTNQFVKDDIDHFSKRVRLALKEDKVNHPAALNLFWKIRCRLDRSRGECKESPAKKDKREKQGVIKKPKQKKSKSKKLEQKKLEQKKLEQKKLEQKKLEQKKLEQKKLEQKKLEQKQLEQKQLEQKQLEQKQLEQKQLEQKQLEQKQLAQERALEQEKLERVKVEQALEHEKKEREKLEKELEEQKKQKRSWWQF